MKTIRNVKKLNKNIVQKLIKLVKPNEIFHSKITVLIHVCMTTFDCYGSS